MAHPHESLFKSLKAVWLADTTLGIGDADSRPRDFIRRGEPRLGELGQPNRHIAAPYIVIDIDDDQDDALGSSTASTQGTECVVTFHVFTRQDTEAVSEGGNTDQTAEDKINEAIVTKYHEATLSTHGGWTFTDPIRLDGGRGPSDGVLNHFLHRFRVHARQ